MCLISKPPVSASYGTVVALIPWQLDNWSLNVSSYHMPTFNPFVTDSPQRIHMARLSFQLHRTAVFSIIHPTIPVRSRMYLRIHTHTHIHIHIHLHTYMHTHTRTYIHTYSHHCIIPAHPHNTFIHTSTHTHTYTSPVYIHTCTYTEVCIRASVHTYIHIHACADTCVYTLGTCQRPPYTCSCDVFHVLLDRVTSKLPCFPLAICIGMTSILSP